MATSSLTPASTTAVAPMATVAMTTTLSRWQRQLNRQLTAAMMTAMMMIMMMMWVLPAAAATSLMTLWQMTSTMTSRHQRLSSHLHYQRPDLHKSLATNLGKSHQLLSSYIHYHGPIYKTILVTNLGKVWLTKNLRWVYDLQILGKTYDELTQNLRQQFSSHKSLLMNYESFLTFFLLRVNTLCNG